MKIDDNIKYQTKPNYIRRKVGGNDILIPVAENVADFNGFIELNPAAAFIWDSLKSPADIHEISIALAEKFDIDEATAKMDTKEFISLLSEHRMLVEV
ncbi:MAG: PqqD family protein [Clostridia bacterium]|nr:PqqD family protein [Clostridia bacterium]